ncbi:MAG: DUF1559 domain-containing protein [Planctomycetaceae bacterium]|nr:DUF1559 domain-containing protein [Planctomycetaceae bacterium]
MKPNVPPEQQPMQFTLRTIFLAFVVVWSSLALGGAILADPFAFLAIGFAVVAATIGLAVRSVGSRKKINLDDGPRLLLVFIGLCAFCYLLALPCIESRETSRMIMCRINLQHIGRALQNYAATYGTLPPAYVADKSGNPMHSWRVLILPFLEDASLTSLHKRYRFDEPWDGPNNRKLIAESPRWYCCPEDAWQPGHVPKTTSYVAIVGPKTAWPGAKGVKLRKWEDRSGDTILLVEVANSDILWSEPRDLSIEDISQLVHASSGTAIANKHHLPCGFPLQESVGTINALRADGNVGGLSDAQMSTEWADANCALEGYRGPYFATDLWTGGGVNWRNCATLLIWTASMYLLLRRASRYRSRTLAVPDQATETTMPTKVN